MNFTKSWILPLGAVAALGLLAAGCPCKRPHVEHAGNQARPCGCKGPCQCRKGYRHGKMGCKSKKYARKRYKMMRKIKRMGAPKMLCGKKLKRHAKVLGLTPDQLNKLAAIKKAAQAGKTDARLKVKQAAAALQAEWLADQPDAAKIQQLAKTLLQAVQGRLKAKMMANLQKQQVLTAQQWTWVRGAKAHGRHHRRMFGKKRCGCKGACRCPKKACGCKGPCRCKGKYHARKYRKGKYGKGRVMKKLVRMGAPKLLCPKKLMWHAQVLNITDEQKAKLKAAMMSTHKAGVARRIATKRAFLQLKLAWLADQPDQAALAKHGQAVWKGLQDKLLAKLALKLAVQKILTPEQWKKVRTGKGCCKGKRNCLGNCKGCKGGCKGCKSGCKGGCKGRRPCRGAADQGA